MEILNQLSSQKGDKTEIVNGLINALSIFLIEY